MNKGIKIFFAKIKSSIDIKEILILLIIFIFCLTPLIWFKNDLIIAGGDHLECFKRNWNISNEYRKIVVNFVEYYCWVFNILLDKNIA